VNQAKLCSYRTAPHYKYRYEIPRDYGHAMCLDAKNGNTCWHDTIALELAQLHEYKTFTDHGKDGPTAAGYKKI
jgi:hypothetical protein